MQTEINNSLYTYDDYLKLDDANQYELIGGKLILVPAPRTIHQKVTRKLIQIIGTFIDRNDLGELYGAPIDVLLTNTDKPQPDILFISKKRIDIITEKNIQGAPDLIIEILSPSTSSRDKVEKSRLYYNHGVKEYWIVDPDIKVIEVLSPGKEYWNIAGAYGMDDIVASPLLAGLEIPLKDIFL